MGTMNSNLQALDGAVRAACPEINGVWIGNLSDKTTWGIWFQPSATSAQQVAAQAALQAFTVS